MTRQDAVANVHTILATLYPDEASSRLIVQDANLNSSRIVFPGAAIHTCYSIRREAENTNKMEDMCWVVLNEYDANPKLCTACEDYLCQMQDTSGIPVGPSSAVVAHPTNSPRVPS